jgi:hypothetical protein
MNIADIPSVDLELVKSIPWTNSQEYDQALFKLGSDLDATRFLVLNPHADPNELTYLQHFGTCPTSHKCIAFTYNGTWLGKVFPKTWVPNVGYENIEVQAPHFYWMKNQHLDRLMTFKDDPFGKFKPEPWDRHYKLVWYLDPRVNPYSDKVWAVSCTPVGIKIKGEKDMGYVMPDINVEINDKIPDLNLSIDKLYPSINEIDHICAWRLNPEFSEQEHWVVKFSPNYRNPKEWKWMGDVNPNFTVIYNPDLGELNYDLDYIIPLHDLKYQHVWYLDRKHLQNGEEDIWAFKIGVSGKKKRTKSMGYISPRIDYIVNESLPDFKFNVEYDIPWYDLKYKHIWYLDQKFSPSEDKIWAVTVQATDETIGEKEIGILIPLIPDQLDVIFISYHEPSAEENWQRVLEKAPWAKRVDGVKGIFNAHKAAAELSSTDMFYVVDGDAWLVDDWAFDYQPGIFDRDCAYVWYSRNPINDLEYGYGGVKLFSKYAMLTAKKMTKLDMTTSVMPKLKVMEKVSNETRFNVDEFSTWRSAFRECVKLYVTNQMSKLDIWLTIGKDKKFGDFSLKGAVDAIEFAKNNIKNHKSLLKINNYDWLKNYFNKTTKS